MGQLHAIRTTHVGARAARPDEFTPSGGRPWGRAENGAFVQDALAAALAHELSQPLAALVLNADAARLLAARLPATADPNGALTATLADIGAAAVRAADVVDGLRALFRGDLFVVRQADVNALLRGVAADASRVIDTCGVRPRLLLADGLPEVCAHPILLRLVFLNLMVNAVQAMTATPPAERELHVSSHQTADCIVVEVRDTGGGIPAALRDRIFDDGVSTKGGNLGVGLSLARRIVDAHGGRLDVMASGRRGTVFVVELQPARDRRAATRHDSQVS